MQTATGQKKKEKRNSFWPNVDTPEGATWAVKQAFWAAVIVSAVTALFSFLAIMGVELMRSIGVDGWSLIDAMIFAGVAFGLSRHSRVAAWIGFILFTLARITIIASGALGGLIVSIVLILAFLGGVRGTRALHRMKTEQPEQVEQLAA